MVSTSNDIKKDGTRIFVDGKLIGFHKDGQNLVDQMRDFRRSSKIHPHVGISIHKPEEAGATQRLYVNCNAGRVLRPLVIIKDGKNLLSQDILEKITKKLISWNDLVRMGIIELLDAK